MMNDEPLDIALVRAGVKPAALARSLNRDLPLALVQGLDVALVNTVINRRRNVIYHWSVVRPGNPHAYWKDRNWRGLGYPECCVIRFDEGEARAIIYRADPYWRDRQRFFIPCDPHCAKAIETHELWWRILGI